METIPYAELTAEKTEALNIALWGEKDAERLSAKDPDEAIEYIIDGLPHYEVEGSITVVGYQRMKASFHASKASGVVEDVLDTLDEEYGDPDGSCSGSSPDMIAAAQKLLDVILAGYEPWACEPVLTVDVPIKAWMEQHRPDWLEEAAISKATKGK